MGRNLHQKENWADQQAQNTLVDQLPKSFCAGTALGFGDSTVDVLIIGAGPAGLFAARELSSESKLSVAVIDMGREIEKRVCPAVERGKCARCDPCQVMCGMGGAGGMSSGILNLRYDVGGDLSKLTGSVAEAKKLVDEVDAIFLEHGAPKRVHGGGGTKQAEELRKRATRAGIEFLPIPQRHIGSEYLPSVVSSFELELKKRKVKFMLNSKVERIGGEGVIVEGRLLKAKYILAAPGRIGASWLARQVRALGIEFSYGPIDVGVRVEVPERVMAPIVEISRDPKFYITTKTFKDFVRSFCVNPRGHVMEERYDDFAGVNGQSLREKKSSNTNFALLTRVELTQPVTDTLAYGSSIARLVTTIGGGYPLLQRLGDLRAGRRSTWERIERGEVKPTLHSVTPGDISMALPSRIVTDIVEALELLDEVIPNVTSDSTLLYAPETKLYAMKITVDRDMRTSMPNLFVAGDGAGLSRGIVAAAATGLLAARGILRRGFD